MTSLCYLDEQIIKEIIIQSLYDCQDRKAGIKLEYIKVKSLNRKQKIDKVADYIKSWSKR